MALSAAKTFLLGLLGLLFIATPLVGHTEAARDVSQYNLTNRLGLKGFDPVAIFPEGGGHPAAGSNQIQVVFAGVTYQFSSIQNRALFMSNPTKYEPTYGGWCAYAMSYGTKVDIQPQLFTLHGNRAHYFVSARAKANFDGDLANREPQADGYWKQISGENPRQ